MRRAARRVMIVVISDFLVQEPITAWRRAARRHDTIALRLVDPREERLPAAGLLALEDSERGGRRVIDTNSKRVRQQYEKAAEQRATSFRRWCANSAIQGFSFSSEVDPILPLIEVFRRRAARRGGS